MRFRDDGPGFPAGDVEVLRLGDIAALIARYRGDGSSGRKPILFLGHMDVVEALAEDWERPPFQLTSDDTYFYARGTLDNKFGLPIPTGHAEQAVADAQRLSGVDLVGLHCHLGSPLFDVEPYDEANAVMLLFAADMAKKHGLNLREYSPGGGFASQYVREKPAPDINVYAQEIVSSFKRRCEDNGLALPRLFVEPGRSLVARACVALYTVGARKSVAKEARRHI